MPLPNDQSRITDGLAKLETSNPNYTNARKEVASRQLIRKQYVFNKPAVDGAAATVTAYTAANGMRAKSAGRILGVSIASQGALTVDATNNAAIKAISADGLGGAEVVGATLTTDVASGFGNWVAGSCKGPGAVAALQTSRQYAIGAWLGFSIAKNGTGVAVPVCQIIVDVEEEGPDAYPV